MNKNYLILLLFVIISTNVLSQSDKAKHFVAGATISTISYKFIYKKTKNHPKSLLLGMASGVIAGVIKESIDPVFDKKDLAATALGSFTFTVTINLLSNQSSRHRH